MSDFESQFRAITGATPQETQTFYEMSGGSLELAISIFFEGSSGSAGLVDAAPVATEADPSTPLTEWHSLVWPTAKIPDSWSKQALTFSTKQGEQFGLLQSKNGPCGVLAALQAQFFVELQNRKSFGADSTVEDDTIAIAIARIISRCAVENSSVVICTFKDQNQVQEKKIDLREVQAYIEENLSQFKGEGGLILLVYSALLTHGTEFVMKEMMSEGGESSLIVGPYHLCTSELISLLLRGYAKGNVGAFTSMGLSSNWDTSPIGMLSFSELENNIPVCNSLKSPTLPIWILHGGDHFTTLFATSPIDREKFTLYQWNGLRPNGPRMAKLELNATNGSAQEAPEQLEKTFFKPLPGEIEDVIQANPTDKKERKHEWNTWKYEVILTVEDETIEGAERPPTMPIPPTFELGQPPSGSWRCASCYHNRFKTMNFGMNDGGHICEHCNLPQEEAGWSLWMRYDELPSSIRAKIDRNYGPKIASILSTKWPGCSVKWTDSSEPPSI